MTWNVFLQAYLQNTGARATAFQNLTTNDAAAARVIEQRMKKLVQMQVCTSAHQLKAVTCMLQACGHVHMHCISCAPFAWF